MASIFSIIGPLFYLTIMSVIFLTIVKKSNFWPIFLSIEYFYIIGIGFYPLLLLFDFVAVPVRYSLYKNAASFNMMTFLHIAFYAIGAAVGFFFCKRLTIVGASKLIVFSIRSKIKPFNLFYALAFVAILAALIYFYVVGFERALLGASSSRGGDFSEFIGFEEYVFLKRFTILGLYAIAAFPFIVVNNIKFKSSFLVLFSVGILAYITTVSRFALFESIVVPSMIYFSYRFKVSIKSLILFFVFSIFSYFVLFYGKEFVGVFANYLLRGGELTFSKSDNAVSFFDGFSHLLFSIDAGVVNYFRNGPFLARDIFLSFVGFFPSSIFTALGIPEFSYQFAESYSRSSCINTKIITGNFDECFIPPYFTGVSAYAMPLVGGFIFALFRFYIYAVMHRSWILLKGKEYYLLVPYIVFLILNQVMLFIPSTISLAVFFCILFFLYLFVRRFFVSSNLR